MSLLFVAGLVATQSMEVTGGEPVASAGLWIIPSLCLAGLAALVGFWAVERRGATGWQGLARRYLGVAVPPYVLVVAGAALVMGPALTALDRRAYVADQDSWAYLLNLVAIPRYTLPGVFTYNDLPEVVNRWVWLTPVFCVLLVLGCAMPVQRSIRWLPAALFALVALAALVGQAIDFAPGSPDDLAAVLAQGDGLTVVLAVLLGMAVAIGRDRVPVNGWLELAAVVAIAALARWGDAQWLALPAFRIATIVPATYLAVALSLRRWPLAGLATRVEPILPALFLAAYPLQQAAIDRGPPRQGFLLNLALAAPVATTLAVAYWWAMGRRLVPWAPPASPAADEPSRERWGDALARMRSVRRADLAGPAILSVAVSAMFVLVMALLYIASVPDDAGG